MMRCRNPRAPSGRKGDEGGHHHRWSLDGRGGWVAGVILEIGENNKEAMFSAPARLGGRGSMPISKVALRSEVLSLYREILRTARVFRGNADQHGGDWMERLVQSARGELEAARNITSSEDITRRIVVARDALYKIQAKLSSSMGGGGGGEKGTGTGT